MDRAVFFFLPAFAGEPLCCELHKKNTLIFNEYQGVISVGMTGFEPATTRPPDVYSNRAELHPEEQLGLWLSLL